MTHPAAWAAIVTGPAQGSMRPTQTRRSLVLARDCECARGQGANACGSYPSLEDGRRMPVSKQDDIRVSGQRTPNVSWTWGMNFPPERRWTDGWGSTIEAPAVIELLGLIAAGTVDATGRSPSCRRSGGCTRRKIRPEPWQRGRAETRQVFRGLRDPPGGRTCLPAGQCGVRSMCRQGPRPSYPYSFTGRPRISRPATTRQPNTGTTGH